MKHRVLALVVAMACLTVATAWAQSPFPPQFQLAWGSAGAGNGQFNQPWGVAWSQLAGRVYVTDQMNNRVQFFTNTGVYMNQWGVGGAGNGQFNRPLGVAAETAAGNVYVADWGNARVQMFAAGGAWMANIGVGQLNRPWGVATDNINNRLYVTDVGNNRVFIFTLAGALLGSWGGAGVGGGMFNGPRGVAFDPTSNRVYVADYGNNLVQIFNPGGGFMGQWGAVGSGNGQFRGPNGIGCDAQGLVYVSDDLNNRVQKFIAGGGYLTQWGTAGNGNGQFASPSGVALDNVGDVFVADMGNNRIQKFLPVFLIAASAGTGGLITPKGAVAVPYGGSQSFTITPDACYLTGDVVVDGLSLGPIASYTFSNVTANHTISATFVRMVYTIMALNGTPGGAISPWGSILVPCGTDTTFTILPDSCHHVADVVVDDVSVGPVTTYTFVNVLANHSIGASYALNSLTITASADAHGSISPTGAIVVPCGETRTFTITADPCYDVGDVLVDGMSQSPVASYLFKGVWQDHTIAASFVHEQPSIASVLDIRNDQGRQVRIRFYRANEDIAESHVPVVQYEAYRRIDALPGGLAARAADAGVRLARARALGMISSPGLLLAGWEFVGAVPAHGESEYNLVAPTLVDSNGVNGLRYSVFFIRAATGIPTTFFDSCPDSGWSVDNLPPLTPAPFVMTFAGGETRLHWPPNLETDLAGYRIHRGASSDFVPGPGNLVSAQPDTGYGEAHTAGYYYKLCAVDVNGNLSGYAMVTPLLAAPAGGLPGTVWLGRPAPNPSSDEVAFTFGLPRAAHVKLAVFDASGREIRRLLDGERAAGEHHAAWDGREASGHACPSAVYFCRLEAEGKAYIARMIRIH